MDLIFFAQLITSLSTKPISPKILHFLKCNIFVVDGCNIAAFVYVTPLQLGRSKREWQLTDIVPSVKITSPFCKRVPVKNSGKRPIVSVKDPQIKIPLQNHLRHRYVFRPQLPHHITHKTTWIFSCSFTLEQRQDWIQLECTLDPRVPWERPLSELRNEPPLDMSVG